MLHDLTNDDGYVALKRTAEDREEQTNLLCSIRLLNTQHQHYHIHIIHMHYFMQ